MTESLWQRAALAVTGLMLMGALAGCAAAAGGTAAVAVPAKPAPAKTLPPIPFKGSEKADGLTFTLAVDPTSVADHYHIAVTVDKPVKAVEAQMVMAEMGHGDIVELSPTGPNKFEADTEVINMSGKWLARIEAAISDDETKAVQFYMQAPTTAAK
jgi:hypothetical protein